MTRMPDLDGELSLPQDFLSLFRPIEVLGSGVSSVVVRARQEALGRTVVVKALRIEHLEDSSFLARFEQEARLLSSLEHPNLLQLLDFGLTETMAYMVYPDDRGEALDGLLRRWGRMSPPLARAFFLETLSGLAHLHEHGVIHRDLKPANILRREDGTWQLFDLGLAKPLQEAEGLTATGYILGTPVYMSSRHALGEPPMEQDDLYSLGVVGYEILAGVNPFHGPDLMATLERHSRHVPPPLTDLVPYLDPEISDLVTQLLEKDPRDRPNSAKEARSRLSREYDSRAVVPPPKAPPSRRAWSRSPLWVVPITLLMLTFGWMLPGSPEVSSSKPSPTPQEFLPISKTSDQGFALGPLEREFDQQVESLPRDLAEWATATSYLPRMEGVLRALKGSMLPEHLAPGDLNRLVSLGRQFRSMGFPDPTRSFQRVRPVETPTALLLDADDAENVPSNRGELLEGWLGAMVESHSRGMESVERIHNDLRRLTRSQPPLRPVPDAVRHRWRLAAPLLDSEEVGSLKKSLDYIWYGGPEVREGLFDWLEEDLQHYADFHYAALRALRESPGSTRLILEFTRVARRSLSALTLSPLVLPAPVWKLGGDPESPREWLLAGLTQVDAMNIHGKLQVIPEESLRSLASMLEKALVTEGESPRAEILAPYVFAALGESSEEQIRPQILLQFAQNEAATLRTFTPVTQTHCLAILGDALETIAEKIEARGDPPPTWKYDPESLRSRFLQPPQTSKETP